MPRAAIALEEHKSFIIDSIELVGLTQGEVCRELFQSHGIELGRSTLMRALRRWGFRIKRQPLDETPALLTHLEHFFHQTRQTDAVISKILTEDEGIDITPQRVGKLRKTMGLYKRVDAAQREAAEADVEEILKKELENEETRKLGGKSLYRYLRKKYNITGRDRVFAIAKRLDPEGPERRLRAQRKEARRTGLEKERLRQSQQQQQQHEGEGTIQEQSREVEQRPLPTPYLPLDPAIYHANYAVHIESHPAQTLPASSNSNIISTCDQLPMHDTFQQHNDGRHVVAGPDQQQHPHPLYAALHHGTVGGAGAGGQDRCVYDSNMHDPC